MGDYAPTKLPQRQLSEVTLKRKVCAVAQCRGPYKAVDSFHKMPKDKDLQREWISACKRKDEMNLNRAEVCSRHFTDEDFDRDLRSELLYGKKRRRLKPSAIPTLALHPSLSPLSVFRPPPETSPSVRQHRAEQRPGQANNLLSDILQSSKASVINHDEACQTANDQLKVENSSLRREIRALQQELIACKSAKHLVECQRKRDLTETEKIAIAKDVLSKTAWSKQQIDYFLEKKTKAKWSLRDITLGLTLRGLSRRTYEYLRTEKLLPLPGPATLRRHIKISNRDAKECLQG